MDRGVAAAARLPEGDRKEVAIQALARSEAVSVWIGVEDWLFRRFGADRCHAAWIRRALGRSSFARP